LPWGRGFIRNNAKGLLRGQRAHHSIPRCPFWPPTSWCRRPRSSTRWTPVRRGSAASSG